MVGAERPGLLGLPRGPFLFWGAEGQTMPKMKTNKSIRKRFRVTGTGKLKRRQAGKKHLLSHKTGKRKRQLRAPITDTRKIAKTYIRMMGED